ncbi:putative RNA-binding protein [Lachnellula occidentalis]|uniref:U4/U6 snRNA-associated-splicing factor PRP24 n=1 Tax=Lachnellula occidentalis TaxID=215460 RepID=A0A8H8S2Q7_9HELO|nr:putative RNA-binding protein [Lachnellula occidentalis]
MADPVGEDAWLALVDEASRTAGDLVQRVEVVELYKRAISAEPWSNKLWLAYCEWVWSLHTDCQNGDAGWPEEEQLFGQEAFSLETALNIWQQGAQATQYRLNDSHELWNRWISIEQEQLALSKTPERIERIRTLFLDRLQIPHTTWEETSSAFSMFITKYDEPAWESTMVQVVKLAQEAKDLYSKREDHESKLRQVGDNESLVAAMKTYLDWEINQTYKKPKKGQQGPPLILCVALFERALCSTPLGLDAATWEDYLTFLSGTDAAQAASLPSALSVVQRAVVHCSWSGNLWARYILTAELANLSFEDMERIKHAATNTRELDRDGMEGVTEFYVAWAGYLKRRTMGPNVAEEDIDVAEMGLPTALESIQEWGQRRYGAAEWKGDPLFRIERIFIQYLTQRGSHEEARGYWRRLVPTHGDNYEFWQSYYMWEMTTQDPTSAPPEEATGVLVQAIHRHNLDWPEKIMEMYIRHCNLHEDVDTLVKARAIVYRLSKGIAKRRAREAQEAAALYAQPQAAEQSTVEESPSSAKRKREETPGDGEGNAKKKAKSAEESEALREQSLKRDRENTTVIVTGLPAELTQTKLRQYFKDYGHINQITLRTEADKLSSTAMIEFRSPEDVQSALLRDGKYFIDKQIHVEAGAGLTLYVTNFPPTADDNYLRKLFKDCGEIFSIRWPSLKYNTTRRFCYISFRTRQAAAAATQMDGHSLGGVYKLLAKYSDPSNKKTREGAMAEGREVHITGLDFSLSEDDLKEIFGKYGKVERARILKKVNGESKGAGFVSFENKEEAAAALELDKTKVKSRIMTVEMSMGSNFKTTATTKGSSASPAPEGDGHSIASASPGPDGHSNTHGPSKADISNRTVALMNIPDTVNDARIRAIAEQHGEIVKLVLRPEHQGATIEYIDVAAAGRASLALENYEIAPGRKLRTGSVRDLFAQKDEIRTDKILIGKEKKKAPPTFMQPSVPVKRPGPGGRGGLGVKKGLGYVAPKAGAKEGETNGNVNAGAKAKSNADFKAMFISGTK